MGRADGPLGIWSNTSNSGRLLSNLERIISHFWSMTVKLLSNTTRRCSLCKTDESKCLVTLRTETQAKPYSSLSGTVFKMSTIKEVVADSQLLLPKGIQQSQHWVKGKSDDVIVRVEWKFCNKHTWSKRGELNSECDPGIHIPQLKNYVQIHSLLSSSPYLLF